MAIEEKRLDDSSKEPTINKPVVLALLSTTLFSLKVYLPRVDQFLVVSPELGMIHTTYIPFYHEFPLLALLFTSFVPYTFLSDFFACVGHFYGNKRTILGGFCFVALLPPFVRTSWSLHSHILYTIAICIQPFSLLPLIGAKQLIHQLYEVNGYAMEILTFIALDVATLVNRRVNIPPEWENLAMFGYSLVLCLLFYFFLPDIRGTSERPALVEFGPQLTGFVGFLMVNLYWIYNIDYIDEEKVFTVLAICVALDYLFWRTLSYGYPWSWWSRRKELNEGKDEEEPVKTDGEAAS
ncbi:hypothetical protein C7M61_001350 [Candidozyma pseudohaemuli]|uniref:Uncharacterized protein n=1 Tax=Candidozyma pseudohaemuli TaxID=418784 RepID=A0A2P7Z0D6_9ASCO|nr:hypothetical protein C7M61_001350 [[Candida] pseudohaemulonii]PSK41663.1 hypothetical protein C7M61_001350 [[Candida] pseudohaemulonii]